MSIIEPYHVNAYEFGFPVDVSIWPDMKDSVVKIRYRNFIGKWVFKALSIEEAKETVISLDCGDPYLTSLVYLRGSPTQAIKALVQSYDALEVLA